MARRPVCRSHPGRRPGRA